MKYSIFSMAAILAASGAAAAEPADIAAAVANEHRIESNRELDAGRKPVEVLTFAGLEQGDRVLDVFGGNLYWAEIMQTAIGDEGRLTIWQPSQFFAEEARTRVGTYFSRKPNVSVMVSPFEEMSFGEGVYDFAIVNLNVHDFFWESENFGISRMDPDAHAQQLADALAPGGRLLVIDHRGAPSDDIRAQVEATHRIDPEAVAALFGRAGLELAMTNDDILGNSEDDLSVNVFNPEVRGKTDRFIHIYVKGE